MKTFVLQPSLPQEQPKSQRPNTALKKLEAKKFDAKMASNSCKFGSRNRVMTTLVVQPNLPLEHWIHKKIKNDMEVKLDQLQQLIMTELLLKSSQDI